MEIERLPIGMYDENSYILHDHEHVLFIDPGRYADKIINHVSKNETVDAILLTHGHEDHIGAVDDLYDHYQVPVYISKEDALLVKTQGTPVNGGCMKPLYSPLTYFDEGETMIGTFPVKILKTPGHTTGSVIIQYKNVLFTGDTLFAQSIGRTDFFSGSEVEMMKTLDFIKTLSNDLLVYPGHGPTTSIGHEKMMNVFLNY